MASLSTDHSPILFLLSEVTAATRGKGLWKFNCSLINNKDFEEEMKSHILKTLQISMTKTFRIVNKDGNF